MLLSIKIKGIVTRMEWNFILFIKSEALGIGLAMDAFSVSLANGLNEPYMTKRKMCGIAGIFAFFQAAMPMIGWVCVHTIVRYFRAFQKFVPWIALALLLFIGGQMIREAFSRKEEESIGVGLAALLIQGVATSIDALSVGFTISGYDFLMAVVCSMIIAAVTFVICMAGILIGRRFGTRSSGKASLLGGIILIIIGIEIFVNGTF